MVRGAYMEEERRLAKEQGRESPIWDTIQESHNCYNNNVMLLLKEMKGTDKMVFGTHNLETIEMLKDLLKGDYAHRKHLVKIGQLQGFSDQLTYDLAAEGFDSFKYVPFGPTEEVMPYLVRRGQESRQVLREQTF